MLYRTFTCDKVRNTIYRVRHLDNYTGSSNEVPKLGQNHIMQDTVHESTFRRLYSIMVAIVWSLDIFGSPFYS